VCPHRCGSWNATYRKNGLHREAETKIKVGPDANVTFINTVIPNAIYSVANGKLFENATNVGGFIYMPIRLVPKCNQWGGELAQ
jgi:hypothetical protein